MSIAALILGLIALVALLFAGGLLGGGIGTVELVIWLGLVGGWVFFWLRSHRATTPNS